MVTSGCAAACVLYAAGPSSDTTHSIQCVALPSGVDDESSTCLLVTAPVWRCQVLWWREARGWRAGACVWRGSTRLHPCSTQGIRQEQGEVVELHVMCYISCVTCHLLHVMLHVMVIGCQGQVSCRERRHTLQLSLTLCCAARLCMHTICCDCMGCTRCRTCSAVTGYSRCRCTPSFGIAE